MTVGRDYYAVLGVPRDADAEAIKNAFRRLARRYHPDVSSEPDAEERFKEVAEAYGVLSDPTRRASYDEQGSAGLAAATAEDLWAGIDFTDIFGSGAPAFGSLFGRLFGPSAAAGPRPGEDVHLDLAISLDEVLTGGDHVVTIPRQGPCPQCAGRGSVPGTTSRRCPRCGGTGQCAVASRHGPLLVRQLSTCPDCAGRGRVIDRPCPACAATGRATRNETVTIRIPPGIPEGATLRLTGEGMASPVPGGPAGDVYVTIRTRTDPRFSRVGADLWHDLHVQAPDAALGVTATVPLPGGQARVRVPPGTQPGSVLRIAGKGLPRYGEDGRGSVHLTVIVDIPRQLRPAERQLYEALQAADAGTRAAGSGGPDVPRAGPRMAANSGAPHATNRSPFIFASVLLLVLATASLATGAQDASGLESWGWVMLIFGAVQLLGAAGIWAGSRSWRSPTQPHRSPRKDH
jgi:molecular chaperone DnaJ